MANFTAICQHFAVGHCPDEVSWDCTPLFPFTKELQVVRTCYHFCTISREIIFLTFDVSIKYGNVTIIV